MTSPSHVVVGIEELLTQAKRFGLVPTYRLGTVFATTAPGMDSVMVILDNDTAPSRCYNYAGTLFTGNRVITVNVKPQGLYVLGAVSSRRMFQLAFMDSAVCTTLLALTTTVTDVPGATLTVPVMSAGAKWEVVAVFDAQELAANNNTAVGTLVVQGAAETSMMLYSANFASANNRGTLPQIFEGDLTVPGDYTFKLQGSVTAGTGQWRFNTTHTKFSLKIFE